MGWTFIHIKEFHVNIPKQPFRKFFGIFSGFHVINGNFNGNFNGNDNDNDNFNGNFLIALEDVAGVDFFLYIVQAVVVTVGDDGLALALEFIKVVDDFAAEEGITVF